MWLHFFVFVCSWGCGKSAGPWRVTEQAQQVASCSRSLPFIPGPYLCPFMLLRCIWQADIPAPQTWGCREQRAGQDWGDDRGWGGQAPGSALGTQGHSAPSTGAPVALLLSLKAVLQHRQKPPPSFFPESTLIPFPFSSKFPMKIYYSEWLRCQPNEQGIGIFFLLAFQPLVRLALSKKSRFSMILVPFSCRYYLFSSWQHVGKPIKNQYPGV